jgi:hypothetical protein
LGVSSSIGSGTAGTASPLVRLPGTSPIAAEACMDNGYLTVSEHPVIARQGTGDRMMTDLDILAVRFPRMRDGVIGRRYSEEEPAGPDPVRFRSPATGRAC